MTLQLTDTVRVRVSTYFSSPTSHSTFAAFCRLPKSDEKCVKWNRRHNSQPTAYLAMVVHVAHGTECRSTARSRNFAPAKAPGAGERLCCDRPGQRADVKSAQFLHASRVLRSVGHMRWVTLHRKRFIGRLTLPDCSVLHLSDSQRHLTINELTYCLSMWNVVVIVCQTYWHLKNCARLQMTNCLIKPYPIPVMFCTSSCHRHP